MEFGGAQAPFGVVGGGRDGQVAGEPQDVAGAGVEDLQQGPGLSFAAPGSVAGGGGQPGHHPVPDQHLQPVSGVGVNLGQTHDHQNRSGSERKHRHAVSLTSRGITHRDGPPRTGHDQRIP